jgi:RNA polymerase subunit RPABC4/transcription elongation factor Spt4
MTMTMNSVQTRKAQSKMLDLISHMDRDAAQQVRKLQADAVHVQSMRSGYPPHQQQPPLSVSEGAVLDETGEMQQITSTLIRQHQSHSAASSYDPYKNGDTDDEDEGTGSDEMDAPTTNDAPGSPLDIDAKKCGKCGAGAPGQAKFCPMCGSAELVDRRAELWAVGIDVDRIEHIKGMIKD